MQEVRREDSFESWPRPFDLDLVVEFSEEEADLWFDGRVRFSEAGRRGGVDMLTEAEVSIDPGTAFAVRRRRVAVLLLCKDLVRSSEGFERRDSMNPLSFRFIVDP